LDKSVSEIAAAVEVGFDCGLPDPALTPLSQIKRVPDLMQVNFFVPTIALSPAFEHFPPAFAVAAFAGEAATCMSARGPTTSNVETNAATKRAGSLLNANPRNNFMAKT
jgi:hypothetical protein